MKSLYEGLRQAVEERCTIVGMKDPELFPDSTTTSNGFCVSRPSVDHVRVVIRTQGTWMFIDIHAVREVIRSLMAVIKEWCATTLGKKSEIDEVPNFAKEATSLA